MPEGMMEYAAIGMPCDIVIPLWVNVFVDKRLDYGCPFLQDRNLRQLKQFLPLPRHALVRKATQPTTVSLGTYSDMSNGRLNFYGALLLVIPCLTAIVLYMKAG